MIMAQTDTVQKNCNQKSTLSRMEELLARY